MSRDDRQDRPISAYFVKEPDGFGIGYELAYRPGGHIDGQITSNTPPCS